ncbi:DNA-directed DNA polymerase gamma mip1 [Terramyces sp. JEL0728]|nr:DNA-directed DNA polymerase gamma mip1 [Terramyces sp. JEL0728]
MFTKLYSTVRKNEIGIQVLTDSFRSKLFHRNSKPSALQIQTAKQHLKSFGLLGKTTDVPPVDFNIPKLVADSIEDHFQLLGIDQSNDSLNVAKQFATSDIPEIPNSWQMNEGWTRYKDGIAEKVPFPDDDAIVFDVEVLYKLSPCPVIACAVSKDYWYGWCMPGLFESKVPEVLIPLGTNKKIVIGHHVAYDRARIKEEYLLEASSIDFIDTLSMHSTVGGLSSQQRATYRFTQNDREENPDRYQKESQNKWVDEGSFNSLQDIAKFYLHKKIDKSQRSLFSGTDLNVIAENFQSLMNYCAEDVKTTFQVYQVLLPKFLLKCPHPVSFAGMLHMSKGYLPTNSDWKKYIDKCESLVNGIQEKIEHKLYEIAKEVSEMHSDDYENNDWFKYLKWECKETRMTKPKLNAKGKVIEKARPYKSANLETSGKPKWWVELWDSKEKRIRISLSKTCVPYLLQLRWNNYPLVHTKEYGWLYHTSKKDGDTTLSNFEPSNLGLDPNRSYFRIPHPEGEGHNCGNPLSKSFLKEFESGVLTSDYAEAKELLNLKNQCIYWIAARNRIMSQFVVWDRNGDVTGDNTLGDIGVILPQTAVMGTVTRRATEPTWMTASNAKKNLIGSEIKSKIVAPKGHCIVGADVDSEELWIASLIGDSQFKIHGGTAIGFMTLQGSKALGTDLHSNTGKIVNISRDVAKVFNYSRIYGAGVNHTAQLLCRHNPKLSQSEAIRQAEKLFAETKGKRMKDEYEAFSTKIFWHGGSESIMFNSMEKIATAEDARTPVLNCQIPNTLSSEKTGNSYMTSRVNWVVQSSGVDYLHLLLVSMSYLMKRLNIRGRYLLSIHDEIRYLIKEEDKYLAALALQISNLWTRAMFSSRLGFDDLPLNIAFFSAIDIDHCLRKEVYMDSVTPSNPHPIEPGESLDIYQLLDKVFGIECVSDIYCDELESIQDLKKFKLEPIFKPKDKVNERYLSAQIEKSPGKVKDIILGKTPKETPNSNPKPKGMVNKKNKK